VTGGIGPVALVIAALLTGCRDGDDATAGEPAASGELTVAAASSLTDAFEAYDEDFAGDPRYSFAGSDELAAQIRSGAPVDVFASANTSLPDELHADGLVTEPVEFARNELVLAVPEGSAIGSLDELAAADADVVIGAEGVPVGDYTREVLDRVPADENQAILASVRSEEPEVKGIVGKLVAGAADAGFVYASDVVAAGGELAAIELPAELQPEVAYGIAVVSESEQAALAQEFVDGLLEGPGAQALRDAGFLPPGGAR
jgi:molybdate transport system substrate-binding protein